MSERIDWEKRAGAVADALYPDDTESHRLRHVGAYAGFLYGVGAALTWAEDQRTAEGPDVDPAIIEAMVQGADYQREALLSDEAVERAARAVAGLEPGEDWPTNEQMGGGPTSTRDDEYRSECVRTARAALTAALGEGESDG